VLKPPGPLPSGAPGAPAGQNAPEILVIDDSHPTARALASLLARESDRAAAHHPCGCGLPPAIGRTSSSRVYRSASST
jgi:hypothetical protein